MMAAKKKAPKKDADPRYDAEAKRTTASLCVVPMTQSHVTQTGKATLQLPGFEKGQRKAPVVWEHDGVRWFAYPPLYGERIADGAPVQEAELLIGVRNVTFGEAEAKAEASTRKSAGKKGGPASFFQAMIDAGIEPEKAAELAAQ
jgi:hypothetical protein